MGNLVGYNIYYKYPEISSFRILFEAFQLSSRDVERLYGVFCALDADSSGLISTVELFEFLEDKEASIKFCDRVFTLFDEDASGQIDFREFVVALWNYCTLSHSSLIIFAFDLYDTDETGELSPDEVDNMLKDLYGEHADIHIQAKQIRKDILSMDRRSFFTIDKFREFVRTHPALLFPAFKMQLALQHAVLGTRFWHRCSAKRVRLSDGRCVKMEIIKSMNTQDYMHRKVIASDAVNLGSLSGKTGNMSDGFHVTHPKQQVAALILKATGTLHYRRGDANRNKDKNLFLTANQRANEKYVLETYAQSKLQGLQPWVRHAKYVPTKMPVRRTLPSTAFVGEVCPMEEKKISVKKTVISSQNDTNVEVSSPASSITIVESVEDNVVPFSENDVDISVSSSTMKTTKRVMVSKTIKISSQVDSENATAMIVKHRHQRHQKLTGKPDTVKMIDLEDTDDDKNSENMDRSTINHNQSHYRINKK